MDKLKKKMLFAAWAGSNPNYFSRQNWYNPLKKIFREIEVFDPQEKTYLYGKKEMNSLFLKKVKEYQPDYIFFWLIYDEFYIDTLIKIKQVCKNVKVINFFGDDDVMFDSYTRFFSQFIDYPLVSHEKYLFKYSENNIKNYFFSNGVNINSFHPIKKSKNYDVTFIGTPMGDRVDYIKFLIGEGINVRVYGKGWEKYPEIKNNFFGSPSNNKVCEIINSSLINLSFTKNYEGEPGFKARVFEVSACKAFLLSEYFESYKKFLAPGKEIIMFNDKQDLLEKIRYYLIRKKEREKIANNAYRKVINNYSQEKEFYRIFSEIEKSVSNPNYLSPYFEDYKVKTLKYDQLENLDEDFKDYDYICFLGKESSSLDYREKMQAYTLDKSGAEISICDYYIKDDLIGNYLALYSFHAFKVLDRNSFLKTLNLGQIMVKKEYFLKNIKLFRNFDDRKGDLFKAKYVFIRYPLSEIKMNLDIPYKEMDKISLPLFENELRSLKIKKEIINSRYTYKTILSAFKGNKYLAYLLKNSLKKVYFKYLSSK